MEEITIRKVTPKERILFIVEIAIFIIIFVGLYLYLKHFNAQIMEIALENSADALDKYRDFVAKSMIIIKIIGVIIGIFFFYLAALVFKVKKFPPDSIPIIRDTKIVKGKKAVWLAYLSIFYGIFFAIVSFYIPHILGNLLDKILTKM